MISSSQISAAQKTKGFTLIELILVIGFFGFMTVLLMSHLNSVYQFREVIRNKNELNLEASAILNNSLSSLIRSGFAINYQKTESENSDGTSINVKENVDQLSIYTDRAETQYFTIYRKDHQAEGDEQDTASLYVAFSNGEEFPLHSSELVVEDFNIHIPPDPRLEEPKDVQPYARIYLRLRKRYPLGGQQDESDLAAEKIARTSYTTTITLRNAGPARDKHPLT